MEDILFHQNYVYTGDIIAIALCFIINALLRSTYAVKKRNLYIFKIGNWSTFLAALSSIVYHFLLANIKEEYVILIYIIRALTYIALVFTYTCFFNYLKNLAEMSEKHTKKFKISIYGVAVIHTLAQIMGPVLKIGFYIDENLQVHQNYYTDIFLYTYFYLTVNMVIFLLGYRNKFVRKMFNCICIVFGISFLLMCYQFTFLTTSYTAVSFVFPILATLVLFHYNSYDVETGTLDQYAFRQYIAEMKDEEISLIFLVLPGISSDRLREFSKEFLRKNDTYFNDSCCFRLRDNRMVLVYQKGKNKNYRETENVLFKSFLTARRTDDYRIVLFDKDARLESGLEYLAYCEFVEARMPMNTYKYADQELIEKFLMSKMIHDNLEDIYRKDDRNDPRVKVFCQPVLNTKTNKFTTAEALMRLELPEIGLVFPDQFIYIAEKFNYIHVLSKIILNKTCQCIKQIEEDGYVLERVSINFSVQELKLDSFCQDVIDIIKENGIDCNKIAIELTESKNDKDFQNMRDVMDRLQDEGIKFYLDDFGTGYSNFERIIGLPVDIVKFDRSLTILANKDEQSKFMVGSFSEIFKKADYQILFEGVEDESDEARCIGMNAQYLQGYRYSKPIPIEQLENFLEKK